MNLRILKKKSKQAVPFLKKYYPHALREGVFMAVRGDNYHGQVIRCGCPPKRWWGDKNATMRERRLDKGCDCSHPLKGTPMVGGMSGYYEPEWHEETALDALREWALYGDPGGMPPDEWRRVMAITGTTQKQIDSIQAWMEEGMKKQAEVGQ